MIRGTASECIRGFSVHVPWANNLRVKLLALKFSLILAWQQGVRRIVCEVDCMEVIRLVLHQPPTFHRYLAIISDIHGLLAQDWQCSLHHAYREGNQFANFLAYLSAIVMREEQIWDHPPVGKHLLFVDMARVAHLR